MSQEITLPLDELVRLAQEQSNNAAVSAAESARILAAIGELGAEQEAEKIVLQVQLDAQNQKAKGYEAKILELEERIKALEAVGPVDPIDPVDPPPIEPRWIVPIEVKEKASFARQAGELVSVAVPLAQSMNVRTPGQLALTDSEGKLVPADIRVTSWWNAYDRDAIQWVNVTFEITGLGAEGIAQYRLLVGVPDNSALVPPVRLAVLATEGGPVTVDTGAASFEVGFNGVRGTSERLGFTSVATDTNFQDSPLSVPALTPRSIYVEYAGPLVAYVVVEGTTPQRFGDGNISIRRRYEFRAGQSFFICGERIAWEGTMAGTSPRQSNGSWNAVLGKLVRERFRVTQGTVDRIRLLDRAENVPIEGGPKPLRLAQHLRSQRLTPVPSTSKKVASMPFYSIEGDNLSLQGNEAANGSLSLDTQGGSLAVALKAMHRYEPQAIGYDGTDLCLDLASDRFWLAHRQGFYASYLVYLGKERANLAYLSTLLNSPLRGLAPTEWYGASGAVAGVPHGPLSGDLARYDATMGEICRNTMTKRLEEGFQGLMTWGVWPRYWGQWGVGSGEAGSGVGGWDELYLKANWTDYWNTSRLAVDWSIRTRDPVWIEELAIPAALRVLHTQALIGAPENKWPYLGQVPYGYGLYRSDFNSSHQYLDNLLWYYHLTGDRTVVDLIERGARVQLERHRAGLAGAAGRHANQWLTVYRFLAGASRSSDVNWGAEFDAIMQRGLQQHYLEGDWNGKTEAIWSDSKVTGPTVNTPSFFEVGYYDMENLYWFAVRTKNAPVLVNGKEVTPFQALVRLAKTVCTLGFSLAGGDGTIGGKWARIFTAVWDGARFTSLAAGVKDGQSLLFPDDKPALCSWLSRAASISKDPVIAVVSRSLVRYAFDRVVGTGLPMGKLTGLIAGRLSEAVLREQSI